MAKKKKVSKRRKPLSLRVRVVVTYKLNGPVEIELDKKLGEIACINFGEPIGGGAGFGMRDLCFQFNSLYSAEQFVRDMRCGARRAIVEDITVVGWEQD